MIATRLECLVSQPGSFSSFSHIPRWRTIGAPGIEGKMVIEISTPEDMDMHEAVEKIQKALREAGVKEV